MPAPAPKLVIVDTNCLVRIYFSPLRPILGQVVSGYELKTLPELANELKALAGRGDLAWLGDQVIQNEVDGALLVLSRAQKKIVYQDAPEIRRYGDAELLKYCTSKGLQPIRSLSMCDAKALAASLELTAALATDEWPLRRVAEDYDYDDGTPVELLSSVELLQLLEAQGLLSREDRIKTYADWLKDGTRLLHGSGERYQELFGEGPPTAQD